MIAARPWRNVNQLRRFHHHHPVPFTLAHDACVAGPQIDRLAGIGLADDAQSSGNHIQDLIAVRVHFAFVRRVCSDGNEANGHAIDPLWRTRLFGPGRNGKIAAQIQDKAGDIDRFDLVHLRGILQRTANGGLNNRLRCFGPSIVLFPGCRTA